jgi:hypothetical protein
MEGGMTNHKLNFGLIFILLLFFISCESADKVTSGSPDDEAKIKNNLPPTSAVLISDTDTVAVCGQLNVTCLAEDPENDLLKYEWASFKVTESSTEENYELNYWLNRGEFLQTEKNAVWKPGKLAGKYLILCNVKDKAGYELTAKKIIHAVLSECPLALLTENIAYPVNDFDSLNQPVICTLRNFLDTTVMTAGCELSLVLTGLERRTDGRWVKVHELDYTCTAVGLQYGRIEPGQEIQPEIWTTWDTFVTGHYRLFLPFCIGEFQTPWCDTLYSNEFEIID